MENAIHGEDFNLGTIDFLFHVFTHSLCWVIKCGGDGTTTKVEMESSRCKDVDEKKQSWEGTMHIVALSLISFDECIEESYGKMLMT